MALTDILLGELDNEELILEIPQGTLNAPVDILFDLNAELILEIPSKEQFNVFVF